MVENFATIVGHGALDVCLVGDEKWVAMLLLHPVKIKLIFSCYELPIALAKLPNIDVNLPFSSCTKVALLRMKVTLSNIKIAS
jgi:hypothetical protein